MEILQGWAFEEKQMKEAWKVLLERLIFHPSMLRELWFGDMRRIDELDAYFIGRKYMFKHGFKRNYHLWFYKDE